MPELTVISLGWGVQSFTLAAMVALGELPPVDFAIHADTKHERRGTYAFKARWQSWLEAHGVKVVSVQADAETLEQVGQLIPGYTLVPRGTGAELSEGRVRRQCTGDWKIDPMRRFLRAELARRGVAIQPGIVEQWIGISLDEFQRARTSDVQYISHRYPLLEKRIKRIACIAWLQAHGLEVPPKSSCTFCPFQTISAWQEQKREGGADWEHSVAVDHRVRWAIPPHPVFVHRAAVPLEQAVTIPEDQGRVQADMFAPVEVADAPCDNGGCFI